jgi:RNA polymerase sigma-70 factor (ECF subfamily)
MNDEFAGEVYCLLGQTGQNSRDINLLAEWMRQFGADVLNVAYSYVRDYQQAQDITQDVFLKAFNKMHTFRNDSSARTWLLSITVNRCKDHLRSWHYRNVVPKETFEPTGSATAPEGLVVHQLERQALWQVVQAIPVKYREVLILYYLRDLSGHEIAKVLHTSEQNVRTRLHRARTMLKKKLEETGWDDE